MAAGDLTSVAAVKAYLGETGTSLDVILASLVSATSKRFLEEIGREIESASRTETFSGDGGSILMPTHYPITAVGSLTVDGDAVPARATVDDDGYVIADAIKIELVGYEFTHGVQNVVLTYTAGYATIPTDVAQAVNEWVAWTHETRKRTGLQSQSMEGATVSFSQYPYPLSVKDVIETYRRREFR